MRLDNEQTALHRAVSAGTTEIINILLNHFAEVNAQDNEGRSPLHIACTAGNLNAAEAICQRPNAQLNLVDDEGNSPMHCACSSLQDDVIQFLLSQKSCPVDLAIVNMHGKTPADVLQNKAKLAGQLTKF